MPTSRIAGAGFRIVLLVALFAGAWLLGQGVVQGRPEPGAHRQTGDLPFADVLPTDWYYPYVLELWSAGAISGYADGTFRPNATISRGQFTKVLVLATGIPTNPPGEATFTDVPVGSPFFGYVEAGAAVGLLTGYECGGPTELCDGDHRPYFRPGANVNRGQAAKMLAGALGWGPYFPEGPMFADVPTSNPFYGYINAVAREGIITGYLCGSAGEPCGSGLKYFRPFGNATRAQASKIIAGASARGIGTPPAATPSFSPSSPTAAWTSISTRSPVATATGEATAGASHTATPTWTVIPGGSGITANDPIPCPLWPADNIWNKRIDALPTHVASDRFVDAVGRDDYVSNGFASRTWEGQSIGVPYNVVPTEQASVPITFTDYPDMSDPGPYPYPTYAFVQGATYLTPVPPTGDRHTVVLRAGSCTLYETWHSQPQSDGSWTAANGAMFNLLSNRLRPAGWTSSDAAGFAILPGLIRYDEVETGQITHAIRMTAPPGAIRDSFVWPARHTDGQSSSPDSPPMGTRFRLKASVDVSGYSPRLRTILQALKTYGAFLSDGGDPWAIGGAPDQRWDDVELQQLHGIHGSDFEAVDESGLMIDPDSGRSR